MATLKRTAHLTARCAIRATVHQSRLKEPRCGVKRRKGFIRMEVIVDAVHFTDAWLTGGAGHHIVEGLTNRTTAQLVDDGVFPHATRPRDHDHLRPRCTFTSLAWHQPSDLSPCNRSVSSGSCRSGGSGASKRISRPSRGCVKAILQACRKRRVVPSGPRRLVPLP